MAKFRPLVLVTRALISAFTSDLERYRAGFRTGGFATIYFMVGK